MSKLHKPIDPKEFRSALGEFATGVVVVTASGEGGDLIGMTMSSFNSVSLDPPLVLFSVSRAAYSLRSMMRAPAYAINILSRKQELLSNKFARALSDKWAKTKTTIGCTAAPLLSDALAHFECVPYATYDAGDHVIFVVRVVNIFRSDQQDKPLVFFRGHYQDIRTESESPITWPLSIHY